MQRSLLSRILDWEGLDLRPQTSSVCKWKQMQQEEILTATASSQSLWKWKLRNVTAAIELWGQPGYAMSLLDEDARQVKSCDKSCGCIEWNGLCLLLFLSVLDIGDARRFGKWSAVSSKEHNSPLIRPDMKFLKLFPQNMFLKENSIKPTNKMFPPPSFFLNCTSFAIGKCSFSHFTP